MRAQASAANTSCAQESQGASARVRGASLTVLKQMKNDAVSLLRFWCSKNMESNLTGQGDNNIHSQLKEQSIHIYIYIEFYKAIW